jgi:hypothetical protein
MLLPAVLLVQTVPHLPVNQAVLYHVVLHQAVLHRAVQLPPEKAVL